MKITSIPGTRRLPSLRGGYMVDTVRGVLRVRKWPKKRGPPTSAKQLYWIDWFTQANLLAKYADPILQVRAMEMTKGTGLYPRDVHLEAMRGRLYTWADETGWKWISMAATQDVSDSLDAVAQTPGSLLWRGPDRWLPILPGDPGQVLTSQGPIDVPVWAAAAGGGGSYAGATVNSLSNQSIATSTWTPVIYTNETEDTSLIHDNAVNPSRLTIPAEWTRARLHAGAQWEWRTANWRGQSFRKNGATPVNTPAELKVSVGDARSEISTPSFPVVPGDYFEHVVWHNVGFNINLIGPANHTYFAIERVA